MKEQRRIEIQKKKRWEVRRPTVALRTGDAAPKQRLAGPELKAEGREKERARKSMAGQTPQQECWPSLFTRGGEPSSV